AHTTPSCTVYPDVPHRHTSMNSKFVVKLNSKEKRPRLWQPQQHPTPWTNQSRYLVLCLKVDKVVRSAFYEMRNGRSQPTTAPTRKTRPSRTLAAASTAKRPEHHSRETDSAP
ncbi:unnamed protein product, partial [Ectocarpus sp. 8 AP-2014]